MKSTGRADSALEQLLWAYALGRRTTDLTVGELSDMFNHICANVQPKKSDISRWLDQLPQAFAQMHVKFPTPRKERG